MNNSSPFSFSQTNASNLMATTISSQWKGKKHYNFTPQMKPSTSTHQPRISDEDQTQPSPLYAIKINDMHSIDIQKELIDKYEKNKNNQAGIFEEAIDCPPVPKTCLGSTSQWFTSIFMDKWIWKRMCWRRETGNGTGEIDLDGLHRHLWKAWLSRRYQWANTIRWIHRSNF